MKIATFNPLLKEDAVETIRSRFKDKRRPADVAFMLMLSKDPLGGEALGHAILHAKTGSAEAALELVRRDRYLDLASIADACCVIAREVTRIYRPHNTMSITTASSFVKHCLGSVEPKKEKAAGSALATILRNAAAATPTNDPMRGCLVGLIAAGAIRFSDELNESDQAYLENWATFNEALWGGLASITFPGVAAVTKVAEIATRSILTKVITVRDFKSVMYKVLSDSEQQHLLAEKDIELSMEDIGSALKALNNGRMMEWVTVALHANGLP